MKWKVHETKQIIITRRGKMKRNETKDWWNKSLFGFQFIMKQPFRSGLRIIIFFYHFEEKYWNVNVINNRSSRSNIHKPMALTFKNTDRDFRSYQQNWTHYPDIAQHHSSARHFLKHFSISISNAKYTYNKKIK